MAAYIYFQNIPKTRIPPLFIKFLQGILKSSQSCTTMGPGSVSWGTFYAFDMRVTS